MIRVAALLLSFFLLISNAFGSDEEGRPVKWRTLSKEGVQWLVTPEGKLFYSKGVNFIDGGKDTPTSREKHAFYWKNFFDSMDAWRKSATDELTGWGFNTRGGWCDTSPQLALPLTMDIELGRNPKYHWFDPFDPAIQEKVLEWAYKLTAPHRNDPNRIGYFTDNEVGWWNSALFRWYLGASWENHTKRALWQLIYDHYGGQWERLLKDWVPQGSLGSFEDLKRVDAKMKLRPGGEGIHLVDRFLYLCANHYYATMYRALRQADPDALILGDRLPLYYHQDAVLAMEDYVDVISTNYNVDVPDGWVAPYYFEGLQQLSGKPVLVTEFFFASEENRSGNRNETARNKHPKPGHLMTVQTQAERAKGLESALRNFAGFPNLIGAHWFQYCDEPLGGREDGEDYNMGLIDTANRPYEEVTEAFRRVNPQLETIHGQSNKPPKPDQTVEVNASPAEPQGEGNISLVRARRPISVTDQSLLDWDKARTRLPGFKTPKPYVPFGDVHLTWTPEGLYFASIANTYFDPDFLAYEGEFPSSEAFQIHLSAEVEGQLHQFVIYLVPRHNPDLPDGFEVKPQIYRQGQNGQWEPLEAQGHIQRLDKSLPHMLLEGFLPAEWLGTRELHSGMKLRMNIAITSYYRELTMTWSGTPTLQSAD
jgi:hypothetical protein